MSASGAPHPSPPGWPPTGWSSSRAWPSRCPCLRSGRPRAAPARRAGEAGRPVGGCASGPAPCARHQGTPHQGAPYHPRHMLLQAIEMSAGWATPAAAPRPTSGGVKPRWFISASRPRLLLPTSTNTSLPPLKAQKGSSACSWFCGWGRTDTEGRELGGGRGRKHRACQRVAAALQVKAANREDTGGTRCACVHAARTCTVMASSSSTS